MLFTSPKIPSILRHITVATSACHPVREPPAITLQSSLGNSLVSTINRQIDQPFWETNPKRKKRKKNPTELAVRIGESHQGHLESVGLSCGASGPAAGVCLSASVRDRRSAWQGRASGSESHRGSAWETRSQNLGNNKGARWVRFKLDLTEGQI